jgi:hypothetical protein
MGVKDLGRLHSVLGGHHGVSGALEHQDQQFPDSGLIVDD